MKKLLQFTVLFSLLSTLFIQGAIAGGSAIGIYEVNASSKTFELGSQDQLLMEFDIEPWGGFDIFTADELTMTTISFNCSPFAFFDDAVLMVGDEVIADYNLTYEDYPRDYLIFYPEFYDFKFPVGEATRVSLYVDIKNDITPGAGVCRFEDANFWDKEDLEIYGNQKYSDSINDMFSADLFSFEVVDPNLEIVEAPFTLENDFYSNIELILGADKEVIHRFDMTVTEDFTLDQIFYTCKDQTAIDTMMMQLTINGERRHEVWEDTSEGMFNETEFTIFDSAVFDGWDYFTESFADLEEGDLVEGQLAVKLRDYSYSPNPDDGCYITAINGTMADSTKAFDPFNIEGIGEDNQTTPIVVINPTFPDVLPSHPNSDAILYLEEHGVIDGHPDGNFKPDDKLNRAELTKIIINAGVLLRPGSDDGFIIRDCFPDVAAADWFSEFVCRAKNDDWIQGYPDGMFYPGQNVNRVEALKMVTLGQHVAVPYDADGEWYARYLDAANEIELLFNDPYLSDPGETVTRAELSEMIYRTVLWLEDNQYDQFFSGSDDFYEMIEDLEDQTGSGHVPMYFDSYYSLIGDTQLECSEDTFAHYEDVLLHLQNPDQFWDFELWNFENDFYREWVDDNPMLAAVTMFQFTPLNLSVNSGCLDIAEGYLSINEDFGTRHGSIDDTRGYGGKAPLHIAVDNDDLEMVELLLDYGADTTIETENWTFTNYMISLITAGLTPLDFSHSDEMTDLLTN